MASCLKNAALHVCQSKNKQAREKGKVGQGRFSGERATEQCCCEQLWHSQISPLIAFSWYLNPGPFGFWRPAQTPQSPQRPIQLPDPSLTP